MGEAQRLGVCASPDGRLGLLAGRTEERPR
jgi:hypothetical protein